MATPNGNGRRPLGMLRDIYEPDPQNYVEVDSNGVPDAITGAVDEDGMPLAEPVPKVRRAPKKPAVSPSVTGAAIVKVTEGESMSALAFLSQPMPIVGIPWGAGLAIAALAGFFWWSHKRGRS